MMTPRQKKDRQEILTNAHNDYEKGLNSRAFFKLNNRVVSQDLVQDTFMKTWKYLVKGGKIDIMKAFLYHILNNLIIDEYRKHKTNSLDALLENGFEPASDDSKQMFDVFDGKAAALLIKYLPDKYQKIMQLRYMQDLSLEEISLITGRSKNTVTVQAYRGLEKLKILYNTHLKRI